MDLKRHLRAHWHKLGLDVIRTADDRPYKNFYAYNVRRHTGAARGRGEPPQRHAAATPP